MEMEERHLFKCIHWRLPERKAVRKRYQLQIIYWLTVLQFIIQQLHRRVVFSYTFLLLNFAINLEFISRLILFSLFIKQLFLSNNGSNSNDIYSKLGRITLIPKTSQRKKDYLKNMHLNNIHSEKSLPN